MDKLLRPCTFLRIDIGSPRSVTRHCLIHNGLRGSIMKGFLVRETRSSFLWGRRWRRRRRCSPWRSGAGYFSRSPGCRGRCAGQSAQGRRKGRGRRSTGGSRKGGRRESRTTTHVRHGVKMTDSRTTWANVVWPRDWRHTLTVALLCSLLQVVRVCDCLCHSCWCTLWKFFPMDTADSIVTDINIPQIIECSSPSPATLEILLCLFRTWSFTRFTNDLDSTDNSNSVSSFPMMKFLGLASSWEMRLSGRPDLSRSVSPFLTDCAVPSRRISSWSGRTFLTIPQEVSSGLPDRSYISVSVFHSWEDQARVIIPFWVACWREAFHELIMVMMIGGFK